MKNIKGENHHGAKLTEAKVLMIKLMAIEGKQTLKEIGKMFNVSVSTVSSIKRGKTWK